MTQSVARAAVNLPEGDLFRSGDRRVERAGATGILLRMNALAERARCVAGGRL
jgi:hypothetical protein